jgi:hypothetical protein
MKVKPKEHLKRIQRFYEMLKENRYRFMLYSLVIMLLIPPFLREMGIGNLVFIILLTILLMACMNFLSRYKNFILITVVAFLLTFISGWLSYIFDAKAILIFRMIFVFCFFSLVLYGILKEIRYAELVNSNVIFGTVAAYLLLGIIGGNVFSLLDQIYPGSFNVPLTAQTSSFFSITTLTTVGYGSIYPVKSQAQAVAGLFALTGQLYLTILVAILVGKYLVHSEYRKKKPHE